jgi:homopolymeric O-antigen transport system ATP-binding protein
MTRSIAVENISKQYRIGELHRKSTFRQSLKNMLKAPFGKGHAETFWALKDVSFAANEGEVVGIVGRNGAGKSTLLKVLSKITYPTSGSISITGKISSLLEVGTGFHDELTGRENIFLNGSILGMTKKEIKSKIDEIIAFSGVDKFIDTPVKRYSSGMRLRLGFAVGAHLDSNVLLIDEILAVGDAEFQKKCLNEMNDLGTSGRTVLFVSHNMTAVENLCSRVIWIDDGKVREDGVASDVIKNYLNSFALLQQNMGSELSNIEERRGTGDVKFTGIEFFDSQKKPSSLHRPGDSLVVRLHFFAKKSIEKPNFGFELHTESGTFLSSINTWSSGFETPFVNKGSGCIEFEVDSLHLMPGRYFISLWLDGIGVHYDRIDYCSTLDIEEADYYGTGRGMRSRMFGLVIVPCKWHLSKNN